MGSRFALGARTSSPLGFLRHVVENETSSALVQVLEDKADLIHVQLVSFTTTSRRPVQAARSPTANSTKYTTYLHEPSPKVGIIEKDISPKLCQFAGRVPSAVAQPKIPDQHPGEAVVHARRERGADLGAYQLLFDLERKLCTHLVQFRPASCWDRDHRQMRPVLRLPLSILLVRPAEDNNAVGIYATLGGYGIIRVHWRVRRRSRQRKAERAAAAKALFVTWKKG